MQHRMKCKNDNKLDYINDICNEVENGGEITKGYVLYVMETIDSGYKRIAFSPKYRK